MNRTLTINLGGLVFHIDENAYEVFRNYLDKLKRRFTGSSGEEIITDIESRIAEMFQEKISPAKNVITLDDVNTVISIMGNPEDIAGETEPSASAKEQPTYTFTGTTNRRFYRNPDDKVLGGVCSGIAAYFDIDPLWIRIAFIAATFLPGVNFVFYIVLWVIIPEAKTPSQKLEMRGEAVNISNIEKNVKEEFEHIKERVNKFGKEIASDENRGKVRNFAEKTGSFMKDVVKHIVRFIAGIFGLIITILSLIALVFFTLAILSVIGLVPSLNSNISADHLHYLIDTKNLWIVIIGAILLVGIPLIVLVINGIKLLFRIKLDMRRPGAVLLIFWLIGVSLCIWQGVAIAQQFRSKVNVSRSELLPNFKNKTIILKANKISNNKYEFTDENVKIDIDGAQIFFTDKDDSIVCNDVFLDFERSNNDSVYFIRNVSSRGSSPDEARDLARKINYSYAVNDTSIRLNNAFNIQHEQKYRGQSLHLLLKVPVGYKIKVDETMKGMSYNIDNVIDVADENMAGHTLQMTTEGLICLDCLFKNMEENNSNN